jgi:predicted transposase/invertase (TIGR01784 family)
MTNNEEENRALTSEHDKFVKAGMGIKAAFIDFLNNFMDAELLEDLDINTLERVEESYITEELSEFFADLVWRCQFKNGTPLEIGLLLEHKSWRPTYPHFQPLEYMIGGWRNKRNAKDKPVLLIPFIIYHGKEVWKIEAMQTYFGDIPGKYLRFLPSFDIIFCHVSQMPDSVILACKTSFLVRMLLTLKHSHDKKYLNEHFAELLFWDVNEEKDELSIFFFKAHFVYLSSTSGITKEEIKERINKIDNDLKSKSMYAHEIIEKEAEEKGIEKGIELSAIKLWQNDVAPSMISNILGLPIERVEFLIAEFKKQSKD